MFGNKQQQMSFRVGQGSSIFRHKCAGSRLILGNRGKNGLSMRMIRGLACSRLFIVWVCLQIYCADTRELFSLFFPS